MVSKYQFQESLIYQPNSDTPINKLGITDAQVLTEIENDLLESAFQQYALQLNHKTPFNLAFFCSIHRHTFKTLYEWAGVIRTHDMTKGGSRFCQAAYLPKELEKLFAQLKQENDLKAAAKSSKEIFAERIAHYQCELIALHPFYELNGRTTRLFFDLMAMANDYDPIDYESALLSKQQPNDYIQASIECVQQADFSKLQTIIFNGLNKRETE